MKHAKRRNFNILISALLICGFNACDSDSAQDTVRTDECNEQQKLVDGQCQPIGTTDTQVDGKTDNDGIPDDEPETEVPPTDDNTPEPVMDTPPEDDDVLPDDTETQDPEPATPEDAAIFVTPLEDIITIQNTLDAHFTVSLSRPPASDVVIPVQSSNIAAGTLSAETLTFTSENWNNPQTITITASTKPLPDKETNYTVAVGPAQGDDTDFNSLEAIQVKVKHYTIEDYDASSVAPQSLTLDTETANLLLRGDSVTITANLDPNATDPTIHWEIENQTDNVTYPHLVSVQNDMVKNTITLQSNVVLDSADCKAMHLDYARTLKVTAKHRSGLSASATVELKPYVPLKTTLTQIKTFRDLNTPGYKNDKLEENKYEKGELDCGYYDENTAHVFSRDMNALYVEPLVYKTNNSVYGTRASVLAAARFLMVQFPKDIPYASSGMKDTKTFKTVPMAVGRYTMTQYDAADTKEDYKKSVRIFGLNLLDKAYNSFSSFKDSNVILGGEGQEQVIPWGCQVKNDIGKEIGRNGLRCSGFVSWALRNGRFYFGDFGTVLLSQTNKNMPEKDQCINSEGKYDRRFRCKTFVDGLYRDSSNPNGKYENVYSKINALQESDFVEVSTLTEKSDFKAGDLLWFGIYQKCKYDKSKKQCPIDSCQSGGNGHVAMILGISRNADKTIKYVYVAEATGVSGNKLTAYTIDQLKSHWKGDIKDENYENNTCNYKDTRLIKMDRVYNYYHDNNPNTVKEDLNTYKYTELWF